MIERLIELSLRYRLAVIGATLVLVAAGTWALAHINFDAFPLSPEPYLSMRPNRRSVASNKGATG